MIAIDIISLIVGIVLATALAIGMYTQRERIRALRTTVERQAAVTRERLTRGAEATYREGVVNLANSLHLAGHLVPLEQIAVLPRFYMLPRPFDPLAEENPEYERPLHLLPLIPDWPQVIAPYAIPAIPLERLLRGAPHLALLGLPGSGRTVALALIALYTARQTQADQPDGLLSEVRLPVYIHLDDVNLDPQAYEPGADPLDPLAEAARLRLRGLAARLLGAVQGELAEGRGLILADGWDELPPTRRRQVLSWLRVLMETYPGNRLVMSGPVRGFGPLLDLGLAPVFVLPWGNMAFAELGSRWAAAWPQISSTPEQPVAPPADELVRRAVRGNRALTPLDATLHIWATFAGDDPGEGLIGWYRAFVNRLVPAPELHPALERMAALLLERPEESSLPAEEASAVVDTVADTLAGRASLDTAGFLRAATHEAHLLTERASGRLAFAHPNFAAYFAARSLRDAPLPEDLLDGSPRHEQVLPFLAALRDMTPYAEQRLAASATLLHDHLLNMALWAAFAGPNARWRGPFFKRMAALLLNPPQYPLTRERVMAALVASRDPNVAYIFREGLKSSDAQVRVLSALGLGALGDPELALPLSEMLGDEQIKVEVAATLALGAIGSRTALNALVQVLISGSELARRAAAEMLAALNPLGEGHEVLREAAAEADPATRRAAIYGLDRVDEQWAVELIAEMERRDENWLVRAAASNVMDVRRAGEAGRVKPSGLPPLEDTLWLLKWLEARNESVAPGPQGIVQMIRALQEGDEPTRLAAAEMLGARGIADAIKPLYAALRDPHHEIRDAAYRALGHISLAVGHPLPGVM